MKWRIKNPAPLDSRLKKWGDYHFGRSLAKYLRRLGQEVETDYRPEWASSEPCDVVLALRGKYPLRSEERHPGAFHVLWNMSHPESVTRDEYGSYDLVLIASRTLAKEIRAAIEPPVYEFLQCTDTEEFFDGRSLAEAGRRDIIFVGNTRDERRDAVIWAIEEGFPVKVWGRGWEKWIPPHHVVADYMPNERLGELYGRARLTLNDHWPDMRRHGFVNNRVFDALACGLPVISDRHPALVELFPEKILYYSGRDELVACLERGLLAYPRVEEAARSAMATVGREYSFAVRAERLLELTEEALGRARSAVRRRRPTAAGAPVPPSSPPQPEEELCWCPVCERYSESFLPFGIVKRENARCPHCGSLERHRSAWLFLREHTDLFDGTSKRFLHCSPEAHLGRRLRQLPGIRYVSCDLHPRKVSAAVDLTRMPFAGQSLDCIYCSHVLEHIEEDHRAMAELFRILKPGGWVLVMTPIIGERTFEDPNIRSEEERLKHYGQRDHVRIYGRDIEQRLSAAGFHVTLWRGQLGFNEAECRLMGLKATYVYFCLKPATALPQPAL